MEGDLSVRGRRECVLCGVKYGVDARISSPAWIRGFAREALGRGAARVVSVEACCVVQ
jgi:hypothetical protein